MKFPRMCSSSWIDHTLCLDTNSAINRGFPGGSEVKASSWNAGDQGSIPGSGRSPGEGNGNPLQYSCLENPMEDPGRLQSTGLQRVGHEWVTSLTHSAINKTKKGSLNSWNLYFREKKMDDRQDESVNIWCVRCYKLLLRKGQNRNKLGHFKRVRF